MKAILDNASKLKRRNTVSKILSFYVDFVNCKTLLSGGNNIIIESFRFTYAKRLLNVFVTFVCN